MLPEVPNAQGEQEILNDDDRYSSDPTRRATYILGSTTLEIERYLTRITTALTALPQQCREIFQTGIDGLINMHAEVIPLPYRDQATTLFEETEGLLREKGFRFRSNLLTSREHEKIASSGYGGIYAATDPDIPILILQGMLYAAGKLEPEPGRDSNDTASIEEIDRARRLVGKTRLDPQTGRTTHQVDEEASQDSYHFLSPKRREEIIAREEEIVREVGLVVEAALQEHYLSRNILMDLTLYIQGELTTPQMLERLGVVSARMDPHHGFAFSVDIEAAKTVSFELGNRDRILTPQEILLRVGGNVDQRYLVRPYMPLGVQDGVPVEEIARQRQEEFSMVVNTGVLPSERPLGFKLEGLNAEGDTVKSPTFLDSRGEKSIETDDLKTYFAPELNFPFTRPDDWFYKGSRLTVQ